MTEENISEITLPLYTIGKDCSEAYLELKPTPIIEIIRKTGSFSPLSPNSDENYMSLYIITTCSNIQVMRMKEVITKDEMS